jgi:hypothetical protein
VVGVLAICVLSYVLAIVRSFRTPRAAHDPRSQIVRRRSWIAGDVGGQRSIHDRRSFGADRGTFRAERSGTICGSSQHSAVRWIVGTASASARSTIADRVARNADRSEQTAERASWNDPKRSADRSNVLRIAGSLVAPRAMHGPRSQNVRCRSQIVWRGPADDELG